MPFQAVTKPDIDTLIGDLQDDDGRVRQKACRALSKIGSPAAPALVAMLGDENGATRAGATNALLMMRDAADDAVPALIEALAADSNAIRDSASWTLSLMGEAARSRLLDALDDIRRPVREHAEAALARMKAASAR
jgi:HEAT repeat protein